MHVLDDGKGGGSLVLSPSDLVGHLACRHLTQLELRAARGELVRPDRHDPELDVLTKRGFEHEAHHLDQLRAEGKQIVEIETDKGADGLEAAARATRDAMAAGVDVIYQATFFDGRWRGHADFLEKVPTPSRLGDWSYEPVDTKLARRVRASAVLQLCEYAAAVEAIQGTPPEHVHVVTGDRERHTIRLVDAAAYQRRVRADLLRAVDPAGAAEPTYPEPCNHCGICRWQDVCVAVRTADDHLSLVAGLRRDHARRLRDAGIPTLTALASVERSRLDELDLDLTDATKERLHTQARLQLQQRETGVPTSELLPPEDGRGLALLPHPSPGDVFFDIEGDPWAADNGLEYLFGLVTVDTGEPVYTALWSHSPDEEKRSFEALVDLLIDRLERWPDMHVYHYAPYEPEVLKRLMGQHNTREEDVDALLRAEVFVDLYRVVRQGVRISEDSYSLKKVEHLYLPARHDAITDGASSIVAYEGWLDTHDPQVLDDIAEYNRVDCISTWQLRGWLEQRRADAGITTRPVIKSGEVSEAQLELEEEVADLVERLLENVPTDPERRTDEQQATWLLAQLLGWHRREAKPEWWAHFERVKKNDDDLLDDTDSIGGLTWVGEIGPHKRSVVHEYRFPPEQEHKLKVGSSPFDPRTGKGAGTIVELDSASGVLRLARSLAIDADTPHPTALIPDPPVNDAVLRRALMRVGELVAEHGIDGPGPFRAARDLLLRRPPRQPDGVLPVQGPPGTGKTYTGARMILDAVAAGKKVGVTALSHKAIGNLLREIAGAARERGVHVAVGQKAGENDACDDPDVTCTNSNEEIASWLREGEVSVVGGTPWLWARPEMADAVDLLVVDEAGQLSLANVVAIGGATTQLLLLGDPQQLSQPSRGAHPEGAEASALEHLLGDVATVPEDRGRFLGTSWRLHPDVCRFVSDSFYDGRLSSDPSTARQRVHAGPWVAGTGLRWAPVVHHANRVTSAEEVDEVRRGVAALLGRPFTDRDGETRPLTLDDILVVAPYNAHVARLAEALPEGARVGTVDKFQGQEAPVVIFSMATSSAEDLPRGLDFLLSLNRLNVAISRAQALAVLVFSPALLDVEARSVRQLVLANTLCRFSEEASPVSVDGAGDVLVEPIDPAVLVHPHDDAHLDVERASVRTR